MLNGEQPSTAGTGLVLPSSANVQSGELQVNPDVNTSVTRVPNPDEDEDDHNSEDNDAE